ncbi:MAG: STAS/SEC14 domain-containing protein [Phycisphaeraceae bacterium]|nr:STAS/SEC14 domain-containing protein [Phycisphaeraceae bacterium]
MPLRIVSLTDGNLVTVRASGRLTDEDYRRFVPRIERLIERCGEIRLLFHMDDFHGWDLHGAWDDLRFGLRHGRDMSCIAMVGDRRWEKWMSRICSTFTSAEVRYFDRSELDAARRWVGAADERQPIASSW